jgi:hypothetical protein
VRTFAHNHIGQHFQGRNATQGRLLGFLLVLVVLPSLGVLVTQVQLELVYIVSVPQVKGKSTGHTVDAGEHIYGMNAGAY